MERKHKNADLQTDFNNKGCTTKAKNARKVYQYRIKKLHRTQRDGTLTKTNDPTNTRVKHKGLNTRGNETQVKHIREGHIINSGENKQKTTQTEQNMSK